MKTRHDPDPDAKRVQGVVIDFLPRKGYGFIRGEEGTKVFVHFSDIRGKSYRTLVPGEKVEFSLRRGDRGAQAFDVVRLDPPPEDSPPSAISSKRTW